ncbi:E3 SUMO-protein ligase ZBED1-like [Haliotis rubra]|uniref:E3 SUMO-protein ligase ZBED1-like n=1 Tax=Haliotis rubra TaxID=36100 RepID=UPI001EE6245C|nr:E3 SUMO-protein ligase ZBED1-like [Haliotis rubra]
MDGKRAKSSVWTHFELDANGHYLTSDWQLKSCVIATRRVEERHSGENIAEILKGIQSEFKIQTVSGLTTDNASNMTVAARMAEYPHVRCFAHTLQLAVGDALKLDAVDNVIIHSRKLVSFFSKSLVATQHLEEVQKKLGKPIKHVISDVCTRWNSIYFMFERLVEVHADVVTVLHDDKKHKSLILKDAHWALMEHLVHCLKPLVSATEVLCSEQFPTAAGVYPLVFALMKKHLLPSDLDVAVITQNLRFLEDNQREQLQDHIVSLINGNAQAEGGDPEDDNSVPGVSEVQVKQEEEILPSPKKKVKFSESQKAMSFLLGDIIEISDDVSDRTAKQDYSDFQAASNKLSASLIRGSSFSLNWWRENKVVFPRLPVLAHQYLSIPGTSVPSERASLLPA